MKQILALVAAVAAMQTLTIAAASADQVASAGTSVWADAQDAFSSKSATDGQPFTLRIEDSWFHKNPPQLNGAVLEGHLQDVSPASPLHKAHMSMIFDDLKLPDGRTAPVTVKLQSAKLIEPHTHHVRDAGFVIGGAVVGHMVGKSHGVHHGGLAGAASGFALASSLKSDIKVKRNERFHVQFTNPVDVQ